MTEPVLTQPHADDVVDSAPAARWVVQELTWSPALSDDVIELVAPSVVVSAEVNYRAG
jgi:hypothetical protein